MQANWGPRWHVWAVKKMMGENFPYDVHTSKSGGQDGMFRLGANFRGAKMAWLGGQMMGAFLALRANSFVCGKNEYSHLFEEANS